VIDNTGYILNYASQSVSLEASFARTGDTFMDVHKNSIAVLDTAGASGSGKSKIIKHPSLC
jgi:hypothetical protein